MKHFEWSVRNLCFGAGDSYPICVSFMPENEDQIRTLSVAYQKASPDMIEWRIDHLSDLAARINEGEIPALSEQIRACFPETVLLFTCRTKDEGGKADLAPEEYRELIRQLLSAKDCFDLIDIEYAKKEILGEELLKEAVRAGLLFSFHDFFRTPEDAYLEDLLESMIRDGAKIAKVAVMPEKEEDVERLLKLTRRVDRKIGADGLLMTISMGGLGTVSRIRGREYGSVFTFAGLSENTVSAPGQISFEALREERKNFRS